MGGLRVSFVLGKIEVIDFALTFSVFEILQDITVVCHLKNGICIRNFIAGIDYPETAWKELQDCKTQSNDNPFYPDVFHFSPNSVFAGQRQYLPGA